MNFDGTLIKISEDAAALLQELVDKKLPLIKELLNINGQRRDAIGGRLTLAGYEMAELAEGIRDAGRKMVREANEIGFDLEIKTLMTMDELIEAVRSKGKESD